MLVERLVPGDPAEAELLRRRAVFRDVGGVVVVHLVVVPHGDPREPGVRQLQVGIGLVEGVAQSELVERDRLLGVLGGKGDAAHAPGGGVDAVLVRVVAEVQDEIEVLLGEMGERVVEAVLPLLAGAEREVDGVDRAVRRRRARSRRLRRPVPDGEPVPVLAPRPEAAGVDVDGVGKVGGSHRPASTYDTPHRRVLGHLPCDPHVADSGEPARRRQRFGRQPSPQHDAVGQWVAGGDAERERVGGQRRLDGRTAIERLRTAEGDQNGARGGVSQQRPAVDLSHGILHS